MERFPSNSSHIPPFPNNPSTSKPIPNNPSSTRRPNHSSSAHPPNIDALHSRLDASLCKPTRRVPPTQIHLDDNALQEHTRRNPSKSPFSAIRASLSSINTKRGHHSAAGSETPHPLAHHQLHQPSTTIRSRTKIDSVPPTPHPLAHHQLHQPSPAIRSRTKIDTISHQRPSPFSGQEQCAEEGTHLDSLVRKPPDKARDENIGEERNQRRYAMDRSTQSAAPRPDGIIESAAKSVLDAIICDVVEEVEHKECDVYAVPVNDQNPGMELGVGMEDETEVVLKGGHQIEPDDKSESSALSRPLNLPEPVDDDLSVHRVTMVQSPAKVARHGLAEDLGADDRHHGSAISSSNMAFMELLDQESEAGKRVAEADKAILQRVHRRKREADRRAEEEERVYQMQLAELRATKDRMQKAQSERYQMSRIVEREESVASENKAKEHFRKAIRAKSRSSRSSVSGSARSGHSRRSSSSRRSAKARRNAIELARIEEIRATAAARDARAAQLRAEDEAKPMPPVSSYGAMGHGDAVRSSHETIADDDEDDEDEDDAKAESVHSLRSHAQHARIEEMTKQIEALQAQLSVVAIKQSACPPRTDLGISAESAATRAETQQLRALAPTFQPARRTTSHGALGGRNDGHTAAPLSALSALSKPTTASHAVSRFRAHQSRRAAATQSAQQGGADGSDSGDEDGGDEARATGTGGTRAAAAAISSGGAPPSGGGDNGGGDNGSNDDEKRAAAIQVPVISGNAHGPGPFMAGIGYREHEPKLEPDAWAAKSVPVFSGGTAKPGLLTFKKAFFEHCAAYGMSSQQRVRLLRKGTVFGRGPNDLIKAYAEHIDPFCYKLPMERQQAVLAGRWHWASAEEAIWDLLVENYGRHSNVAGLERDWVKLKQGAGETMATFLRRWHQSHALYRAAVDMDHRAGGTYIAQYVDNDAHCARLMLSAVRPPAMRWCLDRLQSSGRSRDNWQDVAAVLAAWQTIEEQEKALVHFDGQERAQVNFVDAAYARTAEDSPDAVRFAPLGGGSGDRCFKCGREGHHSRDCIMPETRKCYHVYESICRAATGGKHLSGKRCDFQHLKENASRDEIAAFFACWDVPCPGNPCNNPLCKKRHQNEEIRSAALFRNRKCACPAEFHEFCRLPHGEDGMPVMGDRRGARIAQIRVKTTRAKQSRRALKGAARLLSGADGTRRVNGITVSALREKQRKSEAEDIRAMIAASMAAIEGSLVQESELSAKMSAEQDASEYRMLQKALSQHERFRSTLAKAAVLQGAIEALPKAVDTESELLRICEQKWSELGPETRRALSCFQAENGAEIAQLLHKLVSSEVRVEDFQPPKFAAKSLRSDVLSKPLDYIQRNTYGVYVKDDRLELMALMVFVDGGAGVTAASTNYFEFFSQYILRGSNRTMTLIPAGNQGVVVSRRRLRLPISIRNFDGASGWSLQPKVLEIWEMVSLPDWTLILGRPGMHTCELDVYALCDLKFALYNKQCASIENATRSREEEDAFFNSSRVGYAGEPGIYRVDPVSLGVSRMTSNELNELARNGAQHGADEAGAASAAMAVGADGGGEKVGMAAIGALVDERVAAEQQFCAATALERVGAEFAYVADLHAQQTQQAHGAKPPTMPIEQAEALHRRMSRSSIKAKSRKEPTLTEMIDAHRDFEDRRRQSAPSKEMLDARALEIAKESAALNKNPEAIFSDFSWGSELTPAQRNRVKRALVGSGAIATFATQKWDVSSVKCDPFRICVKDEGACRLLPPYPLNDADLEILNADIDIWKERGIARDVKLGDNLVQACPAFIVHRVLGVLENGEQIVKSRTAVNSQHLNANTIPYPNFVGITMAQLQEKISRYWYFNKTDASKFFFCIEVAKESLKYMGVSYLDRNRCRKTLQMLVVMLGLTDAPKYGQEITAKMYENTDCAAFMDDVIGGAETTDEVVENFIRMVIIAWEHHVMLNAKKTDVGVSICEGVGYEFVGGRGFRPLPITVTKAFVYDMARLRDIGRLRSWIGVLVFLSPFIPNAAARIKLLRNLAEPKKAMAEIRRRKDKSESQKRALVAKLKLSMSKELKSEVRAMNEQLKTIPLLHHVDVSREAGKLIVKSDASGLGWGGSLWQDKQTCLVLCRLGSGAWNAAQANASTTEREGLGLVIWMEKNKDVLATRHFFAMTDHAALLSIFGIDASVCCNNTLVRLQFRSGRFSFALTFIKGCSAGIAIEDYLSRYSKVITVASRVRDEGIVIEKDENGALINECAPSEEQKGAAIASLEPREISDEVAAWVKERDLELQSVSALYNDEVALEEVAALWAYAIDARAGEAHIDVVQATKTQDPMSGAERVGAEPDSPASVSAFAQRLDDFVSGASEHILYDGAMCRGVDFGRIFVLSGVAHTNPIPTAPQSQPSRGRSERFRPMEASAVSVLEGCSRRSVRAVCPDAAGFALLGDMAYMNAVFGKASRIDILEIKAMRAISAALKDAPLRQLSEECIGRIRADFEAIRGVQYAHLAPIQTRAQKRAEQEEKDGRLLERLIFKDDLRPVLEGHGPPPAEFKQNPLRTLFELQREEFPNVIAALSGGSRDSKVGLVTMLEEPYVAAVRRGQIGVAETGLLTMRDGAGRERILVPTHLRVPIMHYFHAHVLREHRGVRQLKDDIRERFIWMGWAKDCEIFVRSCICAAAKVQRRKDAGWKEKGITGRVVAAAPNELGLIDMYGPFQLKSGEMDCAAVVMDAFDGLMEASAMRDEFGGASAFAVVKFLFFTYTLRHGHLSRICHDRGTNLNSRLNKLHAMVHGMTDSAFFAYSPWPNSVEGKMKRFGHAARLQVLRKQWEALSAAKASLADAVRGGEPDYKHLIRVAVAANNEVKNAITGFSPYDLRMFGGKRIILDSALRIGRFLELDRRKYIDERGLVDYAKYRKLMRGVQSQILRTAKLRKYTRLNLLFEKSKNEAAEESKAPIAIGSHVLVKRPCKGKSSVETRIGFRVKDIKRKGNKWSYSVLNDATGELLKLPRAHLTALHKPLHPYDENDGERLQRMEDEAV